LARGSREQAQIAVCIIYFASIDEGVLTVVQIINIINMVGHTRTPDREYEGREDGLGGYD